MRPGTGSVVNFGLEAVVRSLYRLRGWTAEVLQSSNGLQYQGQILNRIACQRRRLYLA